MRKFLPNIDWSKIDVIYNNECVLSQMGLKWNENKRWGGKVMKCSVCQKDLSLTKFAWKNMPINGVCYTPVCDECAKIYLNVFLEENDPQFSRESCAHIID